MDPNKTSSRGNQEQELKTWNKFARGFVSFHSFCLPSYPDLSVYVGFPYITGRTLGSLHDFVLFACLPVLSGAVPAFIR